METTFTLDSALIIFSLAVAIITALVAINFVYNLYHTHRFTSKLDGIKDGFEKRFSELGLDFQTQVRSIRIEVGKRAQAVETDINDKLIHIQSEIEKYKGLDNVYARLMYQFNNANATYKYHEKKIFEALNIELSNIYHVTSHKEHFSEQEFRQIIGAKYWFIAKDILKYRDDVYVNSNEEGDRIRLITLREDLQRLYDQINAHKNSIDVKTKLNLIYYVTRDLLEKIYQNVEVKENKNWDEIRRLAK